MDMKRFSDLKEEKGNGGKHDVMPHDDSTIVVDATDEAREYLVLIMNATFDDKTFGAYIRTQLAGDFAFQLAKMLRKYHHSH